MALDITKIIESIEQGADKQLPPVHLWQPEREGEIDIVINEQIQWFHEGAAFQRDSLVKLLSSILRLDGEDYYLVTPQEKLKITVFDVPFQIVSVVASKEQPDLLLAITNTEDVIPLDNHTNWQLREFQGGEIPYIEVRDGLFARVSRSVYYHLIEQAVIESHESSSGMYIISAGHKFSLGEIQEN